MPSPVTVPIGRERFCHASTMASVPAPVLDAINSLETPLTMAEGAVAALNIMADTIGNTEGASALHFLAHHLQQHLAEVREHWNCIHEGVRGGNNG